jgi:transposase
MDAIIERCAGLDVHQATVVACVLIGEADRKPRKEIRTFSTLTRDLEDLRDWLKELGVTHVGMESTGIYWKPVHTILEGHFELIVANAHHIKTVPGQGCRVDRRPGAPRPDQAELRATTTDPRSA